MYNNPNNFILDTASFHSRIKIFTAIILYYCISKTGWKRNKKNKFKLKNNFLVEDKLNVNLSCSFYILQYTAW